MRVVLALLIAAQPVVAAADTVAWCNRAAVARLHASAPDGYATFLRSTEPGKFEAWIDCDDAQFGLPTAVHEATHIETSDTDTFPLTGGGAVARPHEISAFFPPTRIARQFEADDFTATYLTAGKASSATDPLYLLDELNAYTHDLATAVDLRASSRPDEGVDHRDGLAAMMAFVSSYAETARAEEPATWRGLQTRPVAHVVRSLWFGAERVMASSCGIPRYGTRDRTYLLKVCALGPRSAMATLLGRAPHCAAACLAVPLAAADEIPETEGEAAPFAGEEADITPPSARHPFAAAAGPRRHAASD